MRIGHSTYILALACLTCLTTRAQEPLTPLWEHVDPFGAGGTYILNDVLSTRIAYDHGTDRIYRSVFRYGPYRIQVFDRDGVDMTPSPPVEIQGIPPGDYQITHLVQLAANNDTLAAIVHGDVSFSESNDIHWLKVLGTDGAPYFLLGNGSTPLNAYHQDAMGTLLHTDDELREYGPTNWPNGSIAVPPSLGMAVLGNDVVLGAPPSITHIDRNDLTTLAPVVVPSSGTPTAAICIANGSATFNYAAVNSNGIMDVGLADINAGPIWNTTITLPAQALPTAYHVDEQGDLWIAVAMDATGVATLGLLYRFRYQEGSNVVNSYSRRIDGIASNGSRLFLTGRVAGSTSNTYLAAFDTDLITNVAGTGSSAWRIHPNPSSTELRVDGLPPGITRLTITDATGRSVLSLGGPFTDPMRIPVGDLPNGTYVLGWTTGSSVFARAFSVLH